MSRLTKILTGIMVAAFAITVAAVPAKADAAYDAGVAMLQQIAAQTQVSAQATQAAQEQVAGANK